MVLVVQVVQVVEVVRVVSLNDMTSEKIHIHGLSHQIIEKISDLGAVHK